MHYATHIWVITSVHQVLTDVCALTFFVFDDHIEFVTLGHLERFVLGVGGLIRGHTFVCLCDERVGHIATVSVRAFASEFIFCGHDHDAEEETQDSWKVHSPQSNMQ